jgi:hypothetical protein
MIGLRPPARPKKNYPVLKEKNLYSIGFTTTVDSFTPDVKFRGCTKNTEDRNILITGTPTNRFTLPREYHDSMESVLAVPGYYTWILFADGAFSAARTFSNAEIYSKHGDLYVRTPKPVIAAGECRVDAEKNVVYNFESGTFMKDIQYAYKEEYPDSSIPYEEFYASYITPMWEKAGAKTVIMNQTFQGMIQYGVKMNPANVRKYRNAGFTVKKFKSKQNCQKYDERRVGYARARRTNPDLEDLNTWYASQPNRVVPEPYTASGGQKTRRNRRSKRRSA